MNFKYKICHNHNCYSANTKKEINLYMKENNIIINYCITKDNKIIEDKRINPFKKGN